ncbi:MAG: ABC transporter permease [Candidatus Marinimicrobia bacterium]|nr:ABC transporter permease [Candidatus Neomarinimicrobiota bacterium]MCF7827645.1 ABC transporter permease [Candidatus Neomarinimicrobiota bacterium]MCF7881300.1 ABC transporter permease [Candidatus Neomarinimicrobiota bacterium]
MKVLTIARWEFIHRIKSKWFLISTLVLPLIILGFAVLPTLLMQEDTQSKTFALIDETGWVGEELRTTVGEQYTLKDGRPQYQFLPLGSRELKAAKSVADSLLNDGVINGYLVLPGDILDTRDAEYYGKNVGNFKDLSRLQNELTSIVSEYRMKQQDLDPELISEITRQVNLEAFEIKGDEVSQGNELMAFFGPYFYIMLLFFAVFMSSQILMRSVLEERQNRVVEVLVSSVTPNTLMSGKILGLGAMGVVQIAIYMTVGQAAAVYKGTSLIELSSLLGFIVYFIPGFLLYAAFYSAIGSIFTSEQEAQQISGMMSFIAIAPIIFLPFAMNNPESTMVQILSYIPPLTPFFMILRMNIATLPVWEYVVSLGLLVSFTYITIRLAGKVFSTAILMYGKRPTLPEIIRWMRA